MPVRKWNESGNPTPIGSLIWEKLANYFSLYGNLI